MTRKERGARAVAVLKEHYPATCSLEAEKDYELLFSTRLSAQCTDARVNLVTAELFQKYPTLSSIAEADYEALCAIIRPCGLFRTKTADIQKSARMLLDVYGGRVPDTLEELLNLPGVGRKTANLIVSDIYGKPAIVADTHCMRISNRLGLVSCGNDPYKVEMALKKIIVPEEQADFCHRLVHFGRDICTARSPKCQVCPLSELCVQYQKDQKAAG
ncbi:MAG: endonuclease III [Clostridiaceae bacterium]|nr:endonuclease III [Clostridiaceae bacterium]